MRPALRFVAALASGALAASSAASAVAGPPAPHDDPSAINLRCIVVGGALSQSDDTDVRSLGRASLFYFMGRLEGSGGGTNTAARIADTYAKMTADDLKAQVPVCSALFTAASQTLQQVSDSMKAAAH